MTDAIKRMVEEANKIVEDYHMHLVYDGIYIGRNGEEKEFIWMLSEAGTNIVKLTDPKEIDDHTISDLIDRYKKFYIIGKFNTKNNIFMEITEDDVQRLLRL